MFTKLTEIFIKISDILGIEWAPRNLPLSRRLQTLAATGWICLVLFGEALSICLYFKLLYSEYWLIIIIYTVWMMNDLNVCNRGGRTYQWVRNWAWWSYYRDYFPLKLVKTEELDPNRNYLFACFPHGVVCSGAFGAFATNALNFHEIFPGMTCNMITLGGHFLIPFFRDLLLAVGGCSSSQESLNYLLDCKNERGRCVALIVGGAAEALDSHPGEYKVILNRRKGFIKLAMRNGAPLVPVFSFGETDVFRPFNNPKDGILRKFQETIRKFTGISPMFPIGRGVFQYSYGVVPLRAPVTTVVGAPMDVNRNLDPTDEEVDAVHAAFKESLTDLFNKEKVNYLKNHKDFTLIIT